MSDSVLNANSTAGLRRDVVLGIVIGTACVGLLVLLLLLATDSGRIGETTLTEDALAGSGNGESGHAHGPGNVDAGNAPDSEAAAASSGAETPPERDPASVKNAPSAEAAETSAGNAESAAPPNDPEPFAIAPIPENAPPVATSPPAPAVSASAGSAPTADGKSSTFLGLRAEGQSFVYVVDHSGSMQGRRFDRAREELRLSIEYLKPEQAFFVIFFGSTERPMPFPSRRNAGLIAATDDNKRAVTEWIDGMSLGSGTEPAGALASALGMQPDVIFLMSDGAFGDRALQTARRLNRNGRVPIHTIGFEDTGGEVMLKTIAKENRGDYRFVP